MPTASAAAAAAAAAAPVPRWAVVGSFRKRPVPQGEVLDLLSAATSDAISAEDAPILLYDLNDDKDEVVAEGGDHPNYRGGTTPTAAAAAVMAAMRVPRYIARRIDIPPASAVDPEFKSISIAPPFPLFPARRGGGGSGTTTTGSGGAASVSPATGVVVDPADVLNIDSVERPPARWGSGGTGTVDSYNSDSGGSSAEEVLRLMTVIPNPSYLSYALPLALLLGDIALLIASLTTHATPQRFIAAACVLVMVPDILALVLMAKRGALCTALALHVLVWPNVILLYLQPFVSSLFLIRYILVLLMALFVMRLRASARSTFCTLS